MLRVNVPVPLTLYLDVRLVAHGLVPLTLQIRRQQSAICKNRNKAS